MYRSALFLDVHASNRRLSLLEQLQLQRFFALGLRVIIDITS